MSTAYIALGANLGDRKRQIEQACAALADAQEVRQVSTLIENPAVGGPVDSPPFMNGVAEIRTTLTPDELLRTLLKIERTLGRSRRERWAPRTIDLDLLLYDDRIIDTPELSVPHPLMHARRFVLEPMVEIAPDVVHPVLRKTMRELFAELMSR